jgi:branched-chain amino acid aminotransferase
MEVAQIITRGDVWPNSKPNFVMYCRELDWPTLAKTFKNGTRLATSSTRRIPHQSLSPNAKVSNKMSQFVAEREVKAADPDARPLMLDWQGNVAEEASSNIFFVSKGRLMTPSTQNCLPGISRKVTLELAEKMGLETFVGAVSPFDAINSEEAFLTITSYCMIVVTHLDGSPMNGGAAQPGPVTGRLLEAWKEETGIDFLEQARRMGELKSS